MLPKDLTKDLKTRLKTLHGQIGSLLSMVEDGRSPEDILTQFRSSKKQMDDSYHLFLDEVCRKALAEKIAGLVDQCPGNCGQEEKIEFIRKQFPKLEIDDLMKKLREVDELEKVVTKADNNKDVE